MLGGLKRGAHNPTLMVRPQKNANKLTPAFSNIMSNESKIEVVYDVYYFY